MITRQTTHHRCSIDAHACLRTLTNYSGGRKSEDATAARVRVRRQSVSRTMVRATKRKATAPKATSRTAGTYYINKDDDDANDDDDEMTRTTATT